MCRPQNVRTTPGGGDGALPPASTINGRYVASVKVHPMGSVSDGGGCFLRASFRDDASPLLRGKFVELELRGTGHLNHLPADAAPWERVSWEGGGAASWDCYSNARENVRPKSCQLRYVYTPEP